MNGKHPWIATLLITLILAALIGALMGFAVPGAPPVVGAIFAGVLGMAIAWIRDPDRRSAR